MSKTELTEIVLKIFGLYLFVQAVNAVIRFIFAFGVYFTQEDNDALWVTTAGFVVALIIYMVFAWLLIFRSKYISYKLLWREMGNGQMDLLMQRLHLLETAFIVIGSILVLYSLPELFKVGIDYIYFNDLDTIKGGDFVYPIVKLLVGLFTVTNARYFSRVIDRINKKEIKREHQE